MVRLSDMVKQVMADFEKEDLSLFIYIQHPSDEEQIPYVYPPESMGISSAAHAMGKNGRGIPGVWLSNVHLDKTEAERYLNLIPKHYVKLTVQDTGHGMRPQVMEWIFDPSEISGKAFSAEGSGLDRQGNTGSEGGLKVK